MEQEKEDILSYVETEYPEVVDATASLSDWANANPVEAAMLGMTTAVAANYGISEALEEFGSDLNMNSFAYSIPLTPIYDGPIFPFLIPIELSAGVSVQNSVGNPTVYTPSFMLIY